MAARPVWQGFIRFSLVNIPAQGFTATKTGGDGGDVHLHQLHKGCGARVKYEKTCPIHGKLAQADIESGYEFAKDQYVTIEPEALKNLRKGGDKTIGIEAFVPTNCIAPRFFSGRTMYLLPDGPIGGKPYMMLHQLMVEQKRFGFCTAVMNGKEQIMLMRPIENLIGLEFLKYAEEVKAPSELSPQVPNVSVPKKELDLARTLFDQLSDEKFELGNWTNHYSDDLRQLIDAKVKGQEIVQPPEEADQPVAGDLMSALRRSLDAAKANAAGPRLAARPKRTAKPGTAAKRVAARTAAAAHADHTPRRRAG
jgi:DNA end-binding protein Ku